MNNTVPELRRAIANFKKLLKPKKYLASSAIGILVLFVALAYIVLSFQNKPERSVTSFCTYLKANQAPQRDWKADAAYYKELEARAPSGVYQQTKTIRQTYEQMVKNPESAVGLNLSIMGTGNQFNDWVNNNCYSSGNSNTDPGKDLQRRLQNIQNSQNQDQVQTQTL